MKQADIPFDLFSSTSPIVRCFHACRRDVSALFCPLRRRNVLLVCHMGLHRRLYIQQDAVGYVLF
jgi:hypothetical protein